MHETFQEFVDSRGLAVRVDAAAGVVRGVKILGLTSRNGRSYRPEALAAAVGLYEGAKVNVNHPRGAPTAPRDYQDRIGAIRQVALRPGQGLFGDLHFNPKHALAEQLIWDAEHAPENVGFSHNVEATTSRHGGQVIVESIRKVQSVDLVADPATTRGLFEAAEGSVAPHNGSATATEGAANSTGNQQPASLLLATATLEELRQQRPDLAAALQGEQAQQISRLQEEVARLTAYFTTKPQSREQFLPQPAAPRTARDFAKAVMGKG